MEAAAVSAAHGAMGSLLAKLGELLTTKYKLLTEANEQIRFLKSELESMYVFLKKISDTEEPDEQDKCWAKEVRELSYDIDDSVNEFIHRVEGDSSKPRGLKGFIKRITNLLTTMNTRYEIATELEGLRSRVMEVSERRKRYKVDTAVSVPKNTTIDLRVLALYAETADLVGIDGPRDALIRLMGEESVPAHRLKVLSIVGFGGLEKTTLANQIYRKLEGQFQCRAFVSVSQKPNLSRILRAILSQVGFVEPRNTEEIWDEYKLISVLHNFLLDKRYFIVIDDIWDDLAWHSIQYALPKNTKDSRVITTTRIESVARVCCIDHPEYVYKMNPLGVQDSRKLFFRRLFDTEDDCPPYLKEVSDEILKKCGGLPLAINTISSLLASLPNKLKEQWEHVRDSLRSNLEVSPSLEGMRQILNLSYINLPHYLKTCMLYLGIYPEDYTIDKNDLIRQWVAEGFVSKAHGTGSEDIAKCFFNELTNRSMIQPIDTDCNGEVISCRVHDMMLDLILHKSREEDFITTIEDIQHMTGRQDKIRRLSLHIDGAIDDKVVGFIQLSQIRTLARFATTSYSSSMSDLPCGISTPETPEGSRSSYLPSFLLFRHLRVLTIEISRGSRSITLLDFTGICHLFQLRFLNITAESDPVVLPSKIGDLQKLETFRLQTNVISVISCNKRMSYQELPSDIVHMKQLLHLQVPPWRRLPDGIGNMKSLRTLRCFNLIKNSPGNIKGLGELTNLTDLEIRDRSELSGYEVVGERGKEVMRICLEKLRNLKHLNMSTDSDACLDISSSVHVSVCHLQRFHVNFGFWFSRVPGWIGELHSLSDLCLVVKEVLEDDVGVLAQLPSLIHLCLYISGTTRDKIIIPGSGFPVLKHFKLRCYGTTRDKIIIPGSGFPVLKHFKVRCCRIPHLTFEAWAMPNLERLVLCFSANGWDRHGAAPAGIEHLSGLKELNAKIYVLGASQSNKRAAESALRSAADMHPRRPTANIDVVVNKGYVFGDREEPDDEKDLDVHGR